jgi:hypothetical protein
MEGEVLVFRQPEDRRFFIAWLLGLLNSNVLLCGTLLCTKAWLLGYRMKFFTQDMVFGVRAAALGSLLCQSYMALKSINHEYWSDLSIPVHLAIASFAP